MYIDAQLSVFRFKSKIALEPDLNVFHVAGCVGPRHAGAHGKPPTLLDAQSFISQGVGDTWRCIQILKVVIDA